MPSKTAEICHIRPSDETDKQRRTNMRTSTGIVRSIDSPARLLTKADLKAMPTGVYYQQVTFMNGRTQVQKLMR